MAPDPDDVAGSVSPGGPASWEGRFRSTPGRDSPFYAPPPSTIVLRASVAIQLVLLLIVGSVLVAGLVVNHDLWARLGFGALGVVLVGWRWLMFRAAWRALARRRADPRVSASP